MNCSKCGKEYPVFEPKKLWWTKLIKHSTEETEISDLLFKPGPPDSKSYYILCPECSDSFFGGLDYYVDRTTINQMTVQAPSWRC